MTTKTSYLMSICGTPSALTRWIINVSVAIARNVSEDHTFIAASSIEDMRLAWTTKKAGSVVFHSDSPRESLTNLFVRNNYPIVLVSEPLWRVLCYASTIRKLDPILAARFTTQSVCTLSRVLGCQFIFRVSEDNYAERASVLIDRLLGFYGISISDESLDAVLEEMQLIGNLDATVEESVQFHFPEYNCDLWYEKSKLTEDAHFAIMQYEQILRGSRPIEFVWPPSVFYRFQPEIAYLDGPLEMVGAARVLVGGHSLCLPTGHWRARILLDVSENISGNNMLSDVFTEDNVFTTVIATLPKKGSFYYDIEFICSDPFYPIIIRIAIMEGAIEGILTLRQITFTNLEHLSETKQYLTQGRDQ